MNIKFRITQNLPNLIARSSNLSRGNTGDGNMMCRQTPIISRLSNEINEINNKSQILHLKHERDEYKEKYEKLSKKMNILNNIQSQLISR